MCSTSIGIGSGYGRNDLKLVCKQITDIAYIKLMQCPAEGLGTPFVARAGGPRLVGFDHARDLDRARVSLADF